MKGAWHLAARNLRRHRRRNAVTALAVAFGYAGLLVLFGYAGWEERALRAVAVYLQHRGHFSVYAPGGLKRAEARPSRFALPVESQEKIVEALRADPRVAEVGRYLLGSGIAGNGCKSFQMRAVGLEPELERRLGTEAEVVTLFGPEQERREGQRLVAALEEQDTPVLLAPMLAQSLEKRRIAVASPEASPVFDPPGGSPAAPLDCSAPDIQGRLAADPFVQLGGRTVDGQFGAVEARAVGIFHPASNEENKTALQAPLELLQRLYDTDRITYVAAYLRDDRDIEAVERELAARLRSSGLEVSMHRFDDPIANPYLVGNMNFLRAMIAFIVVLVITVVAFSVLNAMTIAAIERTREMGTLRSLGFTHGDLTGLFLREATLLTLLAVGGGALLAQATRLALGAARVRFTPPGCGIDVAVQLMPTPAAWMGTAAFFILLTVTATWLAVRRIAQTNVSVLLAEVAA